MNDLRARVTRCHKVAAHFAAIGGERFLPLFERMERELAAINATESALERARRAAGIRETARQA